MNAMTTLDQIMPPGCPLIDAPSGTVVPDDPRDYEVLGTYRAGGHEWHAVRGPSGQIDVCGPEDGDLHRDVLTDADELAAWVEENYPF
jgi:hypothetical protein